jgi:hypothetical protein
MTGHEDAVLTNLAFMESVHTKSYSPIVLMHRAALASGEQGRTPYPLAI